MTFTLGRALDTATAAHENQTRILADGASEPYICHPIRVMAAVPRGLQMAAVLHDVLEDSDEITASVLYALGCPKPAVQLVECLSRRGGETYMEFIERIIDFGADAVLVKIADVRDNLASIPGTEWERLGPRYRVALERLEAALKETP